jgi:nucleotide-binding universal stress UspA family protein
VKTLETGARLDLKKILLLTDFSEPSEITLPYALALAREYDSELCALHVMTPVPLPETSPEMAAALIDSSEEWAQNGMLRVDSQLAGVPHETFIVRSEGIWPGVERVLHDRQIDLIILGTHGRTGSSKLLLGSVAEEIFRSAHVPVLTIGPAVRKGAHSGGRFYRVLYCTDFSREAEAAAPYAISMAEENQAKLILLNVMRTPESARTELGRQESVANIMHQLYEIVPRPAELWCRPEATVRFGIPGEKILDVAADTDADLIVLGVRDAGPHLGAATHLSRRTAHKVVAHANCPVLTVRG